MNRTNKALVFGLIAVGTGLAVKKLWSLATISDRVSFVVSSFRVHKINVPKSITDLLGYSAQLVVGLKIYNPTNNTVNLQLPSVKILYKGSPIAISTPSSTVTTVAPNSANERSITFNVPLHALTQNGLSADLLNNTDRLSEVLAQNVTIAIVATVNGATISTVQALSGAGLALSAGPRTVLDGSAFNNYFPSVNDQRKRVVRNGEVDDVVNTAIAIVDKHHREAEPIAQVLKGKSVKETASNIFDFAYSYLQYRRDKPGVEELRTPARSWHDGQVRHKQMGIDNAGIDCDDYSIFCGSILKCLDIPFRFRITKYDGRSYFQHIYVYIPATANNPEIIIDPVLDKFDYEKPYSEQKDDFNMAALYAVEGLAGMPIETLSGIDDTYTIESIVTGDAIMQGLEGIEGDVVSAQSVMNSTLDYLIQSRNVIAQNPQGMAAYTNDVASLLAMFDNAINAWNTPDRDRVLDYIAQYEEALERNGVFKPIQGLNGEPLGGFFKKVGNIAKNVGKGVTKVAQTAGKTVAKTAQTVAKTALTVAKPLVATAATALAASNPVTAAFAPFAAKVTNSIIPSPRKPAAQQPVNVAQAVKSIAQSAIPSSLAVKPVVQNAIAQSLPFNLFPAASVAKPVFPAVQPTPVATAQKPVVPAMKQPGPAGYTAVSGEGERYFLPQKGDVAYGANGKFLYKYGQTGSIVFDNATFGGDPAPGIVKKGYYRKVENFVPVVTNPINRVVQNASLIFNSNKAATQPAQPVFAAKSTAFVAPVNITKSAPLPPTPAEQLYQSYAQPTQQASIEQQNETSMSTQNTSEPGFLARNKKPLLVVGGAVLVGTAAYLMLRKPKRAATSRAPSRQGGALAGLPASRKRKPVKAKRKANKKVTKRKAAPKHKSAAPQKRTRRGVKRVTLR